MSMSVHEYWPSVRESIHTPRKIPSKVGTETDQPTTPNMPSPYASPRFPSRRALTFRSSFSRTTPTRPSEGCAFSWPCSSPALIRSSFPSGPFMSSPQLAKASQDIGLQPQERTACAFLRLGLGLEALANGFLCRAEVTCDHCPLAACTHRVARLDQHSVVDCYEHLRILLINEGEQAGHQQQHGIGVTGKDRERAEARFGAHAPHRPLDENARGCGQEEVHRPASARVPIMYSSPSGTWASSSRRMRSQSLRTSSSGTVYPFWPVKDCVTWNGWVR